MRLQSSIGTGWGTLGTGAGSAASLESSSQLPGGLGGDGMGGGGISLDFLPPLGGFRLFCVLEAGGAALGGAGGRRGATRWPITSTFSPSFTCRKLGECASGAVWTLSVP